jgi:hypothetical protein
MVNNLPFKNHIMGIELQQQQLDTSWWWQNTRSQVSHRSNDCFELGLLCPQPAASTPSTYLVVMQTSTMPEESAAEAVAEASPEPASAPPPLATLALALSIEDWTVLGLGTTDAATAPTDQIEVLMERTTALLLVRCVAVVAPLGYFSDLSCSTICRHVLMNANKTWPSPITDLVIAQLREYVSRILKGYKSSVPYHNAEHGFHVVLSTNKLIDLMVNRNSKKPPPTFGLRNDGLALLAQLFAALIHDVEHQGIPNRQLAIEDDRLAILYNDQSIAENWSIYVAFSELLQDDFTDLRKALFAQKEDYIRFRKMVVNLVLTTDIASPERTQLVKSKWKEAFGDTYETIERKIVAHTRRMSLTGRDVTVAQRGRLSRRGAGEVSEGNYSNPENMEEDLTQNNSHSLDGALEDEDSVSVTPDNSETEGDDNSKNFRLTKQQSARFARRRSSCASRGTATSKYRQRLGIMRTVDLSGETLVNYTRSDSIDHSVLSSEHAYSFDLDEDEPNELKATVVMETIMSAADVAHNLQGWDHMVKFSTRLYLELRKAYVAGKGGDPEPRWFENQIGFLESYLLPLAHRLEDTGVFGEQQGEFFARVVEANRDKWLTAGYVVTGEAVAQGAKLYP